MSQLHRVAVAVLVLAMTGCAVDESVSQPDATCDNPAPLMGTRNPSAPGYIVVFKDEVNAAATAEALARKYDFKTKFVYTSALKGFAAELSDAALAGVRCEATVKYVEFEGIARIS